MGKLFASVAALTLATAGTLTGAGPAAAGGGHDDRAEHGGTVLVRGDGTTVTLSRRSIEEGRISFRVSSSNTHGGGSQISLFRLVGHASLSRLKADLAEEFSQDAATAAKGTRDLNRDGRFFGLADVSPGTPATVTERLRAGRYYLMDLGNTGPSGPNPTFTTLTVRDSDRDGDRHGDHSDSRHDEGHHVPTILLTSKDTFVSPGHLPAHGTVTVKNVADTIHFMSIDPVKKGTTDAQVQKYFDSKSQAPPPFAADGPSVGLDVLSPGRQANLSYKLPPGTYVLLCFIADDVTGAPHAAMGMHKVVTLQ